MAKKRKKEDEEEDAFEFPEFDRVQYMKEEVNKGKSVLISLAIAPFFSYASYLIFDITGEWTLGFLLLLPGIFILGPIHNLCRIDLNLFGKKEYATNWAMFFFTWLIVWIILMNPPFDDFADPTVENVRFGVLVDEENSTWEDIRDVELELGVTYTFNLTARITDNVDVRQESVTIIHNGQEGDVVIVDEHYYRYEFESEPSGTLHIFIITAEDVNGHETTYEIERIID